MLNNPADMLSIVLRGALGRSGRKRARRASTFLSGRGGFLTAGTLMAAAGVAWGIFDSMKSGASGTPSLPEAASAGSRPGSLGGLRADAGADGSVLLVPPLPQLPGATVMLPSGEPMPDGMLRVIRLAVSAARADGDLSAQERELILTRAREAGLEAVVDAELAASRPLAEIVSGVPAPEAKKDLYVLAFTIIRADETVSGSERIYLAQLAYQLGLDAATAAQLESDTTAKIDAQDDGEEPITKDE